LKQKLIPKDFNKDDSAPFQHTDTNFDDAIKGLKGKSWPRIALARVNWTANTMKEQGLTFHKTLTGRM
jgi:hypothetical protein